MHLLRTWVSLVLTTSFERALESANHTTNVLCDVHVLNKSNTSDACITYAEHVPNILLHLRC